VKKSNPAPEPHGSPQGCTVRPTKGAGQCSIGVGGGGRNKMEGPTIRTEKKTLNGVGK